jgi:hypothetical protein
VNPDNPYEWHGKGKQKRERRHRDDEESREKRERGGWTSIVIVVGGIVLVFALLYQFGIFDALLKSI